MSELLDERRSPRHGTPERHSPLLVQRLTTIDGQVDMQDRDAISKVLSANVLLTAVWMWISAHQKINFNIERLTQGSSSTHANLPRDALTPGLITDDLDIALRINPFSGKVRKPESSVLETISHELNLHLLPWARVMMFKELRSLDSADKVDRYPPEQLRRIYQVLGYSGDLGTEAGQARVVRDIQGDAANKYMAELTGQGLGNHSDIGLWLLHFRTIANLAQQEPDPGKRPGLVADAMARILLPMLVTGDPEHAIVRHDGVLEECNQVLDKLQTDYGSLMENPENFTSVINKIKVRLALYAQNASAAQQTGSAAAYTDPSRYVSSSYDSE